jgi:hypothetical protein
VEHEICTDEPFLRNGATAKEPEIFIHLPVLSTIQEFQKLVTSGLKRNTSQSFCRFCQYVVSAGY